MSFSAASRDIARLSARPRVNLAKWPTPIERIEDGSAPELLVKRDDLCGYGRGGAKARKIEHLVGHLIERGHDELIAVAGNVTNLAFDLLPALDRHGIAVRLFIADDPPMGLPQREWVFREIRDRVRLSGSCRSELVGRALLAFVRARARAGHPFLLLPGVSHPAALVGNACGFIEMVRQLSAEGRRIPQVVFVAVATGTTLGGFLVGEHLLRKNGNPPIHVFGVQVYPGPVTLWTRALVRWTERFLGLETRLPSERIRIVRSALGGGFGRYEMGLETLCRRVRSRTGLRIDPIFGGKAWWVMERFRKRAGASDGPILYWHCGFTPEWRAVGPFVRAQRVAA